MLVNIILLILKQSSEETSIEVKEMLSTLI